MVGVVGSKPIAPTRFARTGSSAAPAGAGSGKMLDIHRVFHGAEPCIGSSAAVQFRAFRYRRTLQTGIGRRRAIGRMKDSSTARCGQLFLQAVRGDENRPIQAYKTQR
jgi:hypothetical protein